MRPATTATAEERLWFPHLFDRIEVAGRRCTGPAPGAYLQADFDRPSEPVAFSILGAFCCEFRSGPNLRELADLAAEIVGGGFYGLRSARRLPRGDQ